MNPRLMVVSLTASVLLSTGCAAKNRWFSRKDYSEVQDPFMEGNEVADTDRDESDTSGRARLGGSPTAGGSGPKPITRSGAVATTTDEKRPAGRSMASAAYPDDGASASGAKAPGARSLSGPALSDFINSGGKTTPADARSQAATRMPSSLTDPKSAAVRPSAGSLSPAARAATMPNLEDEEAAFSGFMKKQTSAVTSTAQKATEKVQQTENEAADFASWASQQKAQWTEQGDQAVQSVKAAPAAAKNKVRTVSHEARTAVDEAAAEFMTPSEFDTEATEETDSAEPLFQRPAAKSPSRVKSEPVQTKEDIELEFGATESGEAEENPFENPFDVEEQAVQKPASKSSSQGSKTGSRQSARPTIDDSFEMDSGWKPSEMKRP